jgi:hypothetical protein
MKIGGDPENYMDPPVLNVGGDGGGAGSFIASVLDLLGIHRQVAKGPKTKDLATETGPDFKKKEPESNGKKKKNSAPAPKLDVLSSVDSAVTRIPMAPSNNFAPFGMRSADMNRPMTMIDPDTLY